MSTIALIRREAAGWADAAEARPHMAVAVLTLTALVLRVIWGSLVPVLPTSDSGAYMLFARTLFEHGEYAMAPGDATAFWAPGTGAMVAGLWYVFGVSFTPIVVVNTIYATSLVPMTFVLAERWGGTITGLVAAALMAFWPTFVMYVTVIQSELPFLFVLMAGLIAYTTRWPAAWQRIIVSGIFFGIACYFRPVALLLPLALGFVAVVRDFRAWKREVVAAVATMLMMLVVLSPWTYRNYVVLGTPALVSTNFGLALWNGNHPGTPGTYVPEPEWLKGLTMAEREKKLRQEAMDYILAEPGAFVWRTMWKAVIQHRGQTIAVVWNPYVEQRYGAVVVFILKAVASTYWYGCVALGLAGFGIAIWRLGLIGLFHPAFLIWAYFTGVHAVTQAGGRFQLPSVPFVAIMAAITLVLVFRLGDPLGRLSRPPRGGSQGAGGGPDA
ncbi:MAG: glycosyltransferase family 39 protein [Pseudomonadota bacterium]